MSQILITGGAGFIGYHLANNLLEKNSNVLVLDDLNPYYDINLKAARIKVLEKHANFQFFNMDISNKQALESVFQGKSFDYIFHLAAQAGVRYSFENPDVYFKSNVEGTFNLLEQAKKSSVKRLVFGSTSSVYGDSTPIPFKESNVLSPLQFYATTKILSEQMCSYYSKQYGIPTSIFRFFTVYGPWGRPDMALFKFLDLYLKNKSIEIYNHGNHNRSFTYIDDVIHYLIKSINTNTSNLNEVYNLGSPDSVSLMQMLNYLEKFLDSKFEINFLSKQEGDMLETKPDLNKLFSTFGTHEFIMLEDGISNFLKWHKSYYAKAWAGRGSNPEPTD